MIDNSCKLFDLNSVFDENCAASQQQEIEKHLEDCERCQQKLSGIAADSTLWSQVASHLSTVSELALSDRVSTHLNTSNSFVIPNVEGNEQGIGQSPSDWTKILDPPTHPEMLGRIDQFEIESKIGQGGMGIVLKGFDRGLNRAVAIKILAPHLAANGTARRRFAREAQAAAAVVHPNVVPIHSVKKSADRPYIVMELGPHETLQSLVQENGPVAPTDVVRIALQIASGLEAAHKIGLIHRDVKPGNILVEQDVSRVMITDFGLARAVDDAGMTQTGWIAGTPHYMSPEQAKGDDLDARTDLFSLGSLMYFLATGREPFRGEKPYAVIQKIISTQPTNAMEANCEVPSMLADIIEKLLEKDSKDRFQSATELSHVLEQYLSHLQQPKKSQPPKRVLTVRRKRKRAWLMGMSAAAILLAVAIGSSWMNGSKENNESNGGQFPRSLETLTPRETPEGTLAINRPPRFSVTASPSSNNFRFNEDEFKRELSDISSELDALERSLGKADSTELKFEQENFFERSPNQLNQSNKLNLQRDEDEK